MKRHLRMESDTDSTNSQSSGLRLGKCEVCNYNDAKYTCPKCEVKTCCLNCLKIHKKELNCDGIRDRTKYVPLNKMTKMDFMSDYNFLEECTRYVENRKNDKIKQYTRYNKMLPARLFKLRNAAQDRKITLKFLLDNFSKHKVNTTHYDWKDKTIYWRVEWIFVNANNLKYVDNKCSENDQISKLLDKYFNNENCKNDNIPMIKSLEYYQAKGIGNVKMLLKAEGVKKCKNRFFQINCKKTLKENLMGKTIVEFPSIHIFYDDSLEDMYDIIDSDEDVETETRQYRKTLDEIYRKQLEENDAETSENNNVNTDENIQNDMKNLSIKKKRKEYQKKREKIEKEPQNYLFSNEQFNVFSSDTDSDGDNEDNGNETEEEKQ